MNAQLRSEQVVVSAPMSFSGSAARIWGITRHGGTPARAALMALASVAIVCVWTAVALWYVCFGLLLVPYRLIRRGQRRRHADELRHREQLAAVAVANRPTLPPR